MKGYDLLATWEEHQKRDHLSASQAASLVCLEEVLMPGDRTWPEAGASMSLELWEVWRVKTWKDRELCARFSEISSHRYSFHK